MASRPAPRQPGIVPDDGSRASDPTGATGPKDYCVVRDNARYAGVHLIVDVWGARSLDDRATIETMLRDCVRASGASLLHIHLHQFSSSGGISGVAVLAESHISIHTWPERDYAALDLFMCGATDPGAAVPVIRRAFAPARITVTEHLRGKLG